MRLNKSHGIIVGAGITGLTLALELNRAGIAVRLFESAKQINELGVGLSLLPHSVKHLFNHDLESELSRHAVKTKELRFYCKAGKLIWTEPRGIDAGYQVPQYSIHRGRLQKILLQKVLDTLGPDAVTTDHRLVNFSQHQDKVSANFRDSANRTFNIEGNFLIGADGINSAVRAQLHPNQGEPHFAGLMLWRGATKTRSFLSGRSMIMAGHNTQKIVAYPITSPDHEGQQLINWVAELKVPLDVMRTDDWNKMGSRDEFADLFTDWNFPWLETAPLFNQAKEIYKFPMIDREPVTQWSFGRVTLAGDAAHAMYPNGSNGASQGILDAACLARWLKETSSPDEAFEQYQTERLSFTAKLTLDNRKAGPERVLQMVEERCDGKCLSEHLCVPHKELEDISLSYKKLAGFDKKTVNET